ncbi:thioredoxin domain-containing protein 9-like [Fopius arisanus]|uniref:Thioredoxin domain-containing protein 9-like n=1 Tax=Fopius arisanus TaxID=64838 RepID=A0A9R1T0T1_9HYME|nr:PREDICTED: thioredoxin domain-containing protein 9-like [Fopius arisanus]
MYSQDILATLSMLNHLSNNDLEEILNDDGRFEEIDNDIKQHKILEATKQVECQLDGESESLENLDIDDIEKLRKKRLQEMKKVH